MSHAPTLKQLKYLCTLGRTRHFGKAAEHCHVSQSTLSAGIQELEQNLGVVLVERDNRRVMLSPLGETIVARSRTILNHVEDLISLCDASREPLSGKLRLGVIPTIAPFILPELLNALRSAYPACQLYIREDLSANLADALSFGELDILLLALPYPMDNAELMPLYDDRLLLCCPPGHPLLSQPALHSRDLKGQDLLLLEDGHCLREHALDACKLKSNQFSVPFSATSLNTIVQMVANHIGITLLPEMAVNAKILSGTDAVTRVFDQPRISRSIGLAWRKTSPRERDYRLLGDFIRQHRG